MEEGLGLGVSATVPCIMRTQIQPRYNKRILQLERCSQTSILKIPNSSPQPQYDKRKRGRSPSSSSSPQNIAKPRQQPHKHHTSTSKNIRTAKHLTQNSIPLARVLKIEDFSVGTSMYWWVVECSARSGVAFVAPLRLILR